MQQRQVLAGNRFSALTSTMAILTRGLLDTSFLLCACVITSAAVYVCVGGTVQTGPWALGTG